MPIHFFRGSKPYHVIAPIIAALTLSACAHQSNAQPDTFEPKPNNEEDFFRAVEVFIKVDFDKPSIEVEPFDPFCPSEEAARQGKCNVLTLEVPVKTYGDGTTASLEETLSFVRDRRAGGEATKLVHLSRIFFPPDSTGRGLPANVEECRPEKPARQYRWTVKCADGSNKCMRPGDQVIIRPKVSDHLSNCEVTIEHALPTFAVLDRLKETIPEYKCAGDLSPKAPKPPKSSPQIGEAMESLWQYLESDEYRSFVKKQNRHFKAKQENDLRQAKRIFSPQTRGTFSITAVCGPEDGSCPDCCRGSVTSGIPNKPRFIKPWSGIMWDYGIEIWRGGKCVAELDPPGWVEDDGGGPGSGGSGGTSG